MHPSTVEIPILPPDAARRRSREIRRWAETHYGLVTRRKLLDLGLTRHEIEGRIRSERLVPAGPGVYHVGHRSGVDGQRHAGALAAAGPGAALSGPSAAAWLGLIDRWTGPVHLIVPRARHDKLTGVVRHVDVLDHADRQLVRGIACVTPQRAVMDLPAPLLRQALQWLMRNEIPIEPILARMRGRRGAKAFRSEAAQLVPQLAHTMSELEARFLRLCLRFGIPLPVVNGTLAGGDLLDCAWPGHRLVVELDGRRWHAHRDREDHARDRRRILEGRLPFRYGWEDVTRDAARTAQEILRALHASRDHDRAV